MKVSRGKARGQYERQILIGMIVDRAVLGHIAARWEGNLFKAKWSNLIAQWCVDYYKRYEKPPLKHIEVMFATWAEKTKDEATVKLVEKFLEVLSEEYESEQYSSNSEYVVDLASAHFNRIKLSRMTDNIQNDLEAGQDEIAFEKVSKFHRIELGSAVGVDVMQDKEAIRLAIETRREALITYPGDLGKFFGSALCRDGFIAFEGPEKRGKSFWLIDIAWRAMLERRRVAFFEAGDMSQNQIMCRFMERASMRPLFRGVIKYPVKLTTKKKGEHWEGRIVHKTKKFKSHMNWRKAAKAMDKIMLKQLVAKESFLKLTCHPNRTLTMGNIQTTLRDWERQGWIADVIVIDYADILAPEYQTRESRDAINEIWMQMRQISQAFHCLVVTATQSSARAYGRRQITMGHFSEDKRKRGHVTGSIALNQMSHEKEIDLMRLEWLTERDRFFGKQVYVGGCRSISDIAVISTF